MPYLFTKFVKVYNFRLYSNLPFLDIFFIDSYLDNRKQHVYVTVTLLDLCWLIYWNVSLHCTKHRSLRLSPIMPDLEEGCAQRSILFFKLVTISSGVETVVAIFTCVEILKDKILKASLRFLYISLCFDVRGSWWWLLKHL